MSVNVKLGNDTITGVSSVELENAATPGTYEQFDLAETKSVTITLTNPTSPESFRSCTIRESSDNSTWTNIGSVASATGSATVTMSKDAKYLQVSLAGIMNVPVPIHELVNYNYQSYHSLLPSTIGLQYYDEGATSSLVFVVAGSGTITIDRVNWQDD